MSLTKDKNFIHDTAIVDAGAQIGEGTRIWHFSHVMPEAIIGEDCVLGQNCFVGNKVVLGNKVKVQNNVSLYEGLICDDEVFIGPSAVFTNVINPRSFIVRKQEYKKTLLKKGASIGANATIVCGNTVGEYALIGAGTVVTKNVPNFALVVGNPGRQVGWVSKAGHKLKFDDSHLAECPETGERYLLNAGNVVVLENENTD